jgi:DNA-binding FadR family transcriptional regulator
MAEPKPINLADEIFRDLRRQILSGSLPTGGRLPPERELSQAYKTNRNTLREAIRKLEHDRLVAVRHGQGVTVTDFRRTATIGMIGPFFEHSPDLREKGRVLLDLLPARSKLLELAARTASERATSDDKERLEVIAARVASAASRREAHEAMLGYEAWLEALVDAAHSVSTRWAINPFLEAEREVMHRLPSSGLRGPPVATKPAGVAAALRAGNGEEAMACTRAFLERLDESVALMLRASFCDGEAPEIATGPARGRARLVSPPVLQPASERRKARAALGSASR